MSNSKLTISLLTIVVLVPHRAMHTPNCTQFLEVFTRVGWRLGEGATGHAKTLVRSTTSVCDSFRNTHDDFLETCVIVIISLAAWQKIVCGNFLWHTRVLSSIMCAIVTLSLACLWKKSVCDNHIIADVFLSSVVVFSTSVARGLFSPIVCNTQ